MVEIPESLIARREAERALLGALLIEGTQLDYEPAKEVSAIVIPSDFLDSKFHEGQHTRIFTAMLQCPHPHQIAVAQELNRTGQLRKGDIAYFLELVSECPCSLDYLEFAKIVAEYNRLDDKPIFKGGV